MTAALSLIYGEVDERLAAVVGPEGSYERMPSGDPDAFPALEVVDGGDSPSEDESETLADRWDLQFTVFGYVENYGGAAAHDALIALHASTVTALCGDGKKLGGLVDVIEPQGRRTDVAELADVRRMGFAQDFKVVYATPVGNRETLAGYG